jgi:hypothetical protein
LKKLEENTKKKFTNIVKTNQISRSKIKFSFNDKTSKQLDANIMNLFCSTLRDAISE